MPRPRDASTVCPSQGGPATVEAAAVTLTAGTPIGKYVVRRKLAEGGMAEIYLATSQGPEGFAKEVVIKRIRSVHADDPGFVRMFIAEARLASRLNHRNVVQIFDFDKHQDSFYLAMEYVRGKSLWEARRRAQERRAPPAPTLVAQLGLDVARGLGHAHQLAEAGQPLRLVHRDVSPHNVLLGYDGAVKLADFGIAKAALTASTAGTLKGKFAYMSPEQARAVPLDARSDLFSLGIILWELLSGARLFTGESEVAVLRAVQESSIAPPGRLNVSVPADLDAAVMRCLERDRERRWQSAAALERALADVVRRTARSLDDTDLGAYLRRLFPEESGVAEAPAIFAAGSRPRVASPQAATRGPAPPPEESVSIDLELSASGPPVGPASTVPPTDAEQTRTRRRRRLVTGLGLLGLLALGGGAAVALRGAERTADRPPAPVPVPAVAQPERGGEGTAQPDPPPAASAPQPVSAPERSGAAEAAPGRPPAPAPVRPATGRLTVRVRPWADVWIDGVRRPAVQGTETFPVPAGRHRVVLRGPDGVPATFQVVVRAGRTTALPASGGPLDVSGPAPASR